MNTTTLNIDEDVYNLQCSSVTNSNTNFSCAFFCTGIAECNDCPCRVQLIDASGAWGEVMDVIFALLPVILLIYVTMKKQPWPTTVSLPVAALLLAFIRLAYFQSDPILVGGAIIAGLHEALTPLSIMAGAVMLFESMEATYCLPYMMREMKSLTAGHPIAESMIIFAFAYLVEGASGFGTPAALAAPMLVSMGHPGVESVVLVLLFNTFATVWGAVGTPIWFGLGSLIDPNTNEKLSEDNLLQISQKSAVTLGVTGMILLPFILTILVPRTLVQQNWLFVFLSLLVAIGPSALLAHFNYEFPSLVGGLAGCGLNAILITYRVGLKDISDDHVHHQKSVDHLNGLSEHGLVKSYHRSVSNMSTNNTNDLVDEMEKEASLPRPPLSQPATLEPGALNSSNIEMVISATGNDQNDDVPHDEQQQMDNEPTTEDKKDVDAENRKSLEVRQSLQDTVDAHLGPRKSMKDGYLRDLILRTFPIWGVVLMLVITRVESIGLKSLLRRRSPYFSIYLGTYGTFRLSASLVFQLLDIFTYPNLNWNYELLYVPFIIPFIFVSCITIFIYRNDLACKPSKIIMTVLDRLRDPAVALMGALVLVQLMILSDTVAPAFILGTILSDWFQQGFIVISPLLGALGSFFSGSTTVSNLTFGSIQLIAAESIGTSFTAMLALQAVGASIGNAVCLNNIIAASAVVGLTVGEGTILIKTYKFALLSTTLATVIMLALYFRF